MAEGFLRKYLRDDDEVYSAGVEAHGMNPYAMRVMEEAGVPIDSQSSEVMDQYADVHFDHVITVCDNAKERCPVFPGAVNMIHQAFPDPADATGTYEEQLAVYRQVRDMIDAYCRAFAKAH